MGKASIQIIEGGINVDVRGSVSFVNAFDFKDVDRAYIIRFHRTYMPRGWVGHQKENKWFWVMQGVVLIAVVRPDRWESPASNLPVERYVLSAQKPQVLHIPAGYATGSMNLTEHSILTVFSSGKIEEHLEDDYRFPEDTWPIMDRD